MTTIRTAGHSAAACAALLLAGCSVPAMQGRGAAAPTATPAPSYDGHYEGTVRLTGVAGTMDPKDCATEPRVSLDVRDNRFRYALPHPHAAASSPELAKRTTPIYNASIRPNGNFSGTSDDTNTTMVGQVTGTRMTGTIFGLLCYYAFTADRV
jgi:hypothetical protein